MEKKKFSEAFSDFEKQFSGGGGFVGKFRVCFGWKFFATGRTNDESFFEFDPNNPASQKDAEAKCKRYIADNGVMVNRTFVVNNIIMFKDFELTGKAMNWQGDRHFTTFLGSDAYRQIVRKSFDDAGIDSTGDFWGAITFKPDPTGRTRKVNVTLDNGETVTEERPQLVAYVKQVFGSEQEARDYVRSASDETDPEVHAPAPDLSAPAPASGDAPPSYPPKIWEQMKPEIIKERAKGTAIPAIASMYQVTPDWIAKVLSE